ncbi:hypothetical protein VDIAB_240077 [Vibrio diabolicus]|nr:hypothetical protein VDIAB_240077 [Vibrio diabolicus]
MKASVDQDGKLQIFAGNNKVEGEVEFSGGLSGELGLGEGKKVTVDTIDVTSVGGAQESVAAKSARLISNLRREPHWLVVRDERVNPASAWVFFYFLGTQDFCESRH